MAEGKEARMCHAGWELRIMKYLGNNLKAMLGMAVFLIALNSQQVSAAESNIEGSIEREAVTEEFVVVEPMDGVIAEGLDVMYQKSASTTNVSNFGYWVYRPTISTTEELPLIVYMHGIGERGSNLNKLTTVSLPKHLYDGDVTVNAIVICPQCPAGTNWTNLADDVMELINIVCEEENVDRTSISLTGHSLGGIGTWSVALKYPDVFASLVPVSSTIKTPYDCTSIAHIPVWSFHGALDTMRPASMLTAQTVINEAGGNMMVTMFEKEGHCITDIVYNNPEYNVLDWMASQHITIE